MAFTEEQRTLIRHYLGYPEPFQWLNPRLESAIDLIGSRPQAQTRAELILSQLEKLVAGQLGDAPLIEGALVAVGATAVESADDRVEYGQTSKGGKSAFGSATLNGYADYGRLFVGQLSILFGVNVVADIFGGGGYAGDAHMSAWNQKSRLFYPNM